MLNKLKKHKKKLIAAAIMLVMLPCMLMSAASEDRSSDEYAMKRAVKIFNPKKGSCSGEQVRAPSGKDYIMSAGHCKGLMDQDGNFLIQTEDGSLLQRKLIAEDPASDLLLIEGLPNLEGLHIAQGSYRKEHVRTFTHGKGYDTYKTEGNLVGITFIEIPLKEGLVDPANPVQCNMPKNQYYEGMTFFGRMYVCTIAVNEMVTTAKIVPGSSGGMMVDDNGDLVGVASASDGQFYYFVTLSDIAKFVRGY